MQYEPDSLNRPNRTFARMITASRTPSLIENVTCLACGCLCDDLTLVVESGRVVEARRACDMGRAHLLADRGPRANRPPACIEGQPASVSEALDRASELLLRSSSPLVSGLSFATIEEQALAVTLADRLGASIDPARTTEALPRLLALQRAGRVSATLGEIKNRADVVVFWGIDPLSTHPRHLERYSVEPKGRFVPGGRADRHVIVVDSAQTPTAAMADQFISLRDDGYLPALSVLRALNRGARVDPARVEPTCGVSLDVLQGLIQRLRSAHYGVILFGDRLSQAPGGSACVEAAFLLVREINESTRCVILNLGIPATSRVPRTSLVGSPVAADRPISPGDSPDFCLKRPAQRPGFCPARSMPR